MNVAERLGCEDDIFLSDVVRAYENDGQQIGPETTLAVRGLKTALAEIRSQGNDYVREKLAAIDTNFMDLDAIAYLDAQNVGLRIGNNLTLRLSRANRQQIVNFGSWYQQRVDQLAVQLACDQPILAAEALDWTDTLIDQAILPRTARKLMRKSTEWAGDFEPIGSVEQAANNFDGYCFDYGIGMANLYMAPNIPAVIGLQLKQTAFHEYLHGIGHLSTNRRGLFFGLTGRLYGNYNRWLEEAYVSTVAFEAAQQHGRSSALAQLKIPYPFERQFLNLAMKASPLPLDLSDLGAAHFSGRHPAALARRHVFRGLNSALNDLFPEYEANAWQQINKEYETRSSRPARQAYITELLLKATTSETLADTVSRVA